MMHRVWKSWWCLRGSVISRLALFVCLAGLTPSGVSGQGAAYTFVQIGAGFSPAMDVNDDGVVVGYWNGPLVSPDPSSVSRGYLWTHATGAQPIITDPAIVNKFPRHTAVNDFTESLRINADGAVAGVACPQGCGVADFKAGMWSVAQGLVVLGSFDNNLQRSGSAGINAAGDVVGYSFGGGYNNSGPFIWSPGIGLRHLTGFTGINGYATDINENALITGGAGTGTRSVAFVWSAATGHTVIPDVPGTATSLGLAVNDLGVVVGRFTRADQTHGVFRWSEAEGIQDLSAPAGLPELLDINNAGEIVATINTGSGGRVPYIYRDGAWGNVNALMPAGTGFTLSFVMAINNKGWIVGAGTTLPPTELGQGFVLIPPNRAPAANDDVVTTDEDATFAGTLKASDADGDDLTFTLVSNGSNGTATITDSATGAFSYTPGPNVNGTDSFTFRASDGTSESDLGVVTVNILPVNDAPLALDGAASVEAGASVSGTLSGTDIDSANLVYSIVANGSKGVATVENPDTGAYTYLANSGSDGTDTFTFSVTDGHLEAVATITVAITPRTHCAADISGLVTVTSAPSKFNRKTGRYTQTVTVRNADGIVAGPISFVLDGLSSGVSLANASGITACASPGGSPYITVAAGADDVFSPRERITIVLEFVNPEHQSIAYVSRVLAGDGVR